MKLFSRAVAALAALCLVFAAVPAAAQLAPIVSGAQTYGVNISTATTTVLVSGVANKITYVSYAHIESAGTGNITFEYSADPACGSGNTGIGGAISLTAQTGFSGGDGTGAVIVVPKGMTLCLVTSANVQISGWLTAAQF